MGVFFVTTFSRLWKSPGRIKASEQVFPISGGLSACANWRCQGLRSWKIYLFGKINIYISSLGIKDWMMFRFL